jgi:hypothetical protein
MIFNGVGHQNKEIDNPGNKKTRLGKINNTRHYNQFKMIVPLDEETK